MPFDFNQFVNTGQFSDPANYAGFNGQMKSVEDAAKDAALASVLGPSGGGIAPPTNEMSVGEAIADYGKQAIAPIQKRFDTTMDTANRWGSKISNAFGGVAPTQQAAQPTVQPTTQEPQQAVWRLNFHGENN